MNYTSKSTSQYPDELHVPDVQFLCEQDGMPERLLKERLNKSFVCRDNVRKAYLTRISIENHASVALCIKNTSGPDPDLVKEVSAIFATIFGSHEHLDILFLTDMQESSVAKVCSPFYLAPGGR